MKILGALLLAVWICLPGVVYTVTSYKICSHVQCLKAYLVLSYSGFF